MIWIIIVAVLILACIGQHVITPPEIPISPAPSEFAKKLSQIRQAWQVTHYMFSVDKRYLLRYTYLYVYIRKGRKNDYGDENRLIREMVWNFKEGIYDAEVVYRTVHLIKKVVREPLERKALICIPASNSARYEKRFMNFCQEVCLLTGMQNGFSWIIINSARRQSHLSQERSLAKWEDLVDVVGWKLTGSTIILFDDVLTTGKTYGSFKEFLENKGAKVICGIFLAVVPENQ